MLPWSHSFRVEKENVTRRILTVSATIHKNFTTYNSSETKTQQKKSPLTTRRRVSFTTTTGQLRNSFNHFQWFAKPQKNIKQMQENTVDIIIIKYYMVRIQQWMFSDRVVSYKDILYIRLRTEVDTVISCCFFQRQMLDLLHQKKVCARSTEVEEYFQTLVFHCLLLLKYYLLFSMVKKTKITWFRMKTGITDWLE